MLEWLKRHAWKACILQKSIGGSNPPLSAKYLKLSAQRWAFSVQGRQELAPVRTCTEKAQGRKAMSFKCFARAPAASGRGKVTRSVANPPRRAGKGACKGAQRLRKSPAASGRGKVTRSVANPRAGSGEGACKGAQRLRKCPRRKGCPGCNAPGCSLHIIPSKSPRMRHKNFLLILKRLAF